MINTENVCVSSFANVDELMVAYGFEYGSNDCYCFSPSISFADTDCKKREREEQEREKERERDKKE